MENISTNIAPGQGESQAGSATDQSDGVLAPPGCLDSFDEMYEQWALDQELRGLSGPWSSGTNELNILPFTPGSSSLDFDLDEPLRTLAPSPTISTLVPVLASDSNSIQVLPSSGVSSWEFVSESPELSSVPLSSNHAVSPPAPALGGGPIELPVRNGSIPSGYYGDYSNRTTTEQRTSSAGSSLEAGKTRPQHGPPIRKRNSRNKTHQSVTTTPSRLTPEDLATQDYLFAYRNILPKLGSQEGALSHTEPDVPLSTLPSQKGKRKPNTDDDRKKIKLVRRVGACIRCRIFKESCDENTPCGRCMVALANAKVYRLLCYRAPLDNVIAFRAGNARAGKMRSEPMSPFWSSDDKSPRFVILKYPFKRAVAEAGRTVAIECRKFIPHERDVMEEPWEVPATGEVVSMRSSLFACYDQNAHAVNVANYIKATKAELLEESLEGIADQLLRLTTAEATRYCLTYENSAVSTAMNIRAASFFSRTKMIMTGTNVLELPYFGDTRFLINDGYPVPGILDYQIDYLAIRYMREQMDVLVKQLKKLIFTKNQKRSWYEVYLTVFILLQSLETVHARQIQILERYRGRDPEAFARVRVVATTMIEEWEYSARILIYHYRAVLKGMVPFAAVWNHKRVAELRKECGLDAESLEYAREMSDIIRSREESLRQLSEESLDNSSAKPLVWIARLYVDDTS